MQSFFASVCQRIVFLAPFFRCNPQKLDYLSSNPEAMLKSRKNLTRFTYETTAFEGWRLCVSRAGTTFTKYFSDKNYGGGKESLRAAEQARAKLLRLIDNSRRINGKLSKATIEKAHQILKAA
jgi:hypothetical protein